MGIELGELPWGGSFKPGLSIGYHVDELPYLDASYQIEDQIRRDGSSFNVKNTGLTGIALSSEEVAPRAHFGIRLRPHRLAPFASLGLIYNGVDEETMQFDARSRTIGEGWYDGELSLVQRRPQAFRPALGLGYSYTFDWG